MTFISGVSVATTFELQIREFAEKAKGNAKLVVRKVTLDVAKAVVVRSPVGNPELWAANAHAASYNKAVAVENALRRADPANLTKNGRLKPGKKLNDGMDIKKPKGYVGGRFRANWVFDPASPPTDTLDAVDPSGSATTGRLTSQIMSSPVGGVTYVMNNLPYAERLERGWSRQAPAGMVGVSVSEFQQFVNQAIAGVPK